MIVVIVIFVVLLGIFVDKPVDQFRHRLLMAIIIRNA